MSYQYVGSDTINPPYKMPDLSPDQCINCGCYEKKDGHRMGTGSIILAVILLPVVMCWIPFIVKQCQNQTILCQKCGVIQAETPFLC